MEVPVVVQLGNRHCLCGRAGDVDAIDVRQMEPNWMDDDNAVFTLMRSWVHDTIMCAPQRLKIVVLENILLDIPRKKRLCQVLLNRLRVNSVVFLPDVLMACVSAGVSNALVVDVGWEQTAVVPVVDMRILDRDVGVSKLGARWFAAELEQHFAGCGEAVMRSLKVGQGGRYEGNSIPWGDVSAVFERFLGTAGLSVEYDADEYALVPLVLRAVRNLSADVKRNVLPNIVIIGSMARMPGLRQRLIVEIQTEFVCARGIEALSVWQGGSIYTFHSLMHNELDLMEVNRERFKNNGVVPDWQLQRFM
ncbi:AGR099Cp [Eremothecium gossypii ATCC 10895]|uniref:AGR099Cp n=1 Tax=Eremothecium gossypii (strain ATCC 10895 / CBS 109.51 / FGSC 9923 / NRRL Y-1056) TaxID=284811 RepID=Q74ZU9_EREGS|nr:AGR099Cp [Eremothecium gossypii ATCC 10895]AAS54589.1 AGR099Cp [Eremothecium gossypii ATCC 10895]AEY98920.1 FAGR099Cp [Eremothecium gossypii FDAG1]